MTQPPAAPTPYNNGVQAILGLVKKQLVANTLVFTLAEVINKGIPFLLLPITTRFLTPSDYGMVATFTALVNVLFVFVGLSVHGAVNVNYFQLARADLTRYVANVMLLIVASAAMVSLVLLPLANFLSIHLNLPVGWIFIAVLAALAQCVTLLNLVLWQSEQQPRRYGTYQIAQTVLTVALTLLLVVAWRHGWFGQLLANVSSIVVFGIASLGFLLYRGYVTFALDKTYLRDALAFGIPLIPHALSGWFLTGIDRFLLTSILGTAATGEYAVGYQFGLVIGILAASFNKAWMPFLFQRLKDIDDAGKKRIVRFTYAYFAGILGLALLLAAASPWVIQTLLGRSFSGSSRFVFWIALGYAFDGMYYMVVNQIFYMKKTSWLAGITFAVGVTHVAVSYFCIKTFGSIGAAYATTFSFGLSFVLVWILSAKVYPMPWFRSA